MQILNSPSDVARRGLSYGQLAYLPQSQTKEYNDSPEKISSTQTYLYPVAVLPQALSTGQAQAFKMNSIGDPLSISPAGASPDVTEFPQVSRREDAVSSITSPELQLATMYGSMFGAAFAAAFKR